VVFTLGSVTQFPQIRVIINWRLKHTFNEGEFYEMKPIDISRFSTITENVPMELAGVPQWVSWSGTLGEDGKIKKIPINPESGNFDHSALPRKDYRHRGHEMD
jgi:hypothetical protein